MYSMYTAKCVASNALNQSIVKKCSNKYKETGSVIDIKSPRCPLTN